MRENQSEGPWLINIFLITGFPLFSSDKIPWLFQYFFHFSLTFIKYFYGFYPIFIFLCMASTHYCVIVLKVYMH